MGRLKPSALFFLAFPIFIFSCSLYKASPPAPALSGPGIFHAVKRGENLYRIGKAYDLTYQQLARVNGISDPNQISVGQKIFIPKQK